MNLVKGENISISINRDDLSGCMVACWRSSTLQVTADTLGISTVGSGNWKEFAGSALSWTVSGEGLLYMDTDFTIHDVYDLMIQLQPVDVVFTVNSLVSTKYYHGSAIITSLQEQGNVNDNGSFNVSLQGTGELISDDTFGFGNFPALFQIIDVETDDPVPGSTSLDFVWEAAVPLPDDYTIEVYDLSTHQYVTGGEGNSMTIFVAVPGTYEFRIRSNYCGGLSHSEWSAVVNYSETTITGDYIVTGSDAIINDIGEFILTG